MNFASLTDSLINHLASVTDVKREELTSLIEFELGSEKADLTLKIFRLLKLKKIDETQVIESFRVSFADQFENVEAVKGYINFTFKPQFLFELVQADKSEDQKTGQTYMIEYLSPNTNKPLHIGHVRNGLIGSSLANILQAQGNSVIKAQVINDRGIAICKSLLAWKKFGNGATPETASMKGDHFVGEYYVRFAKEAENDPALEQEAQELLQKWESGDEEVIKDWKLLNSWFMEGFRQTCDDFGFTFDKEYFESEVYKSGKDLIEQGLQQGVFRKNEKGAVVIDLPEEQFGRNEDGSAKVMTVLREDGTSLYVTQDLALAAKKFKENKIDFSWNVVGSEQKYYFQVVFYILDKLGISPADKMLHRSYGMVTLPSGKMKSREGTVVDADDLLTEVTGLVQKQIQESERSEKTGVDAKAIALAAIKFQFLKVDPNRDIAYDPKESIDIHGFTGPFCLYAHTRLSKIIEKSGQNTLNAVQFDAGKFEQEQSAKLKQVFIRMLGYESAVKEAMQATDPSVICRYAFNLCSDINSLYESVPVLAEEDTHKKEFLLAGISLAKQYISQSLSLLGIKTVERM